MGAAKAPVKWYTIREVAVASTTCRVVAMLLTDDEGEPDFPVAYLTWDGDTNALECVYVNEEFRGHGIGARLLAYAGQAAGGPLTGSAEHTEAGAHWAAARGLTVPEARISDEDMARITTRFIFALRGAETVTIIE